MKSRLPMLYLAAFFLSCLLPFLLMADFFPFARMGMFAEPIKQETQREQFKIIIYHKGSVQALKASDIGANEQYWLYWTRNYAYRGQAAELLQAVSKRLKSPCDSLDLLKSLPKGDTLLYRLNSKRP